MRDASCAALGAIAHFAISSPQSPALIDPNGETLDYRGLWTRIEALTQRLREAGVGDGQRVAILLPQGMTQVLAVLGALNRHTVVPLQSKTTLVEVETSLHRLSVSALIAAPDFEMEIQAAAKMGLAVLVAHKSEPPQNWPIRAQSALGRRNEPNSDAIVVLITSATTGSSKIVPLTAGNLDAGLETTQRACQLAATDRLLLMVPLVHRNGVENTLVQLFAGGAVITTEGFDPSMYQRWLDELRPTWYICSPTVHQAALVQLRNDTSKHPHSLRFLQSSGARLPLEVREELEQILGVPVLNAYGSTETHHIAMESLPFISHVPDATGRPCGPEIGILGASGELLESNEEGEIVARGPSVFLGYEDNPEASLAAFRDGWFKMGDAGRLDREGNLFVTGRLKEMINRGGEKIVPDEVDAALASHPAVLEAAAFAVPHPTLGEDVACAVVLRPETRSPISIGELRRHAAQRLARFKLPSRIFFTDEIPRGELGKPQRWLLRERFGKKRTALPSPALVTKHAPDDVFFRVYEIWTRILDRDDLGFDENFFDAGGDSLSAMNMLAEVDQRLGSNAKAFAERFLDEPTLANLNNLIGKPPIPAPSSEASSDIEIFPVRTGGSSRQLFLIPANGEEGYYFRRLATMLNGVMDLSIVRPANTWHCPSLFTFEHAGVKTARRIRATQPEGPYYVGGYCYGGIVAVETARQLIREGQDVRLVLFDVLMPGFPSLWRDWRTWVESARCQWRARGDADNANFVFDPRYFIRRLAWFSIIPFRRRLVRAEHTRPIKWLFKRAQEGYLPFYEAGPIDAPILHFLCTDERNIIDSSSRFGWRAVAQRGIEEQFLALEHLNLFHESNLPKIVTTLLQWLNNG